MISNANRPSDGGGLPGEIPAVRVRLVADGVGWEFAELDGGRWQMTIDRGPGGCTRHACSAGVLWRNAEWFSPEIRAALATDPAFALAAGLP